MENYQEMAARDAHYLLDANPHGLLVCAYDDEEKFKQNDLEGAIPLRKLRAQENSRQKNWPIIFYCACPHDEGAKERAQEYADKGFTNVKVLKGGVHAWQEAGFSLVGAGH